MARDLALDLRAFRAPAPVRFYPARGVRYESHLAPPPHLVGLRIAALDSLLEPRDGDPPVVVASAVALMERIPDPELRPHGFTIEVGEELDLDETLERLVACGYEREEQVFERGQFAVRGGILDVYPATEERAVRVELFGDEVESLRWFSTFTQRSLDGRASASRSRPPPSSTPSTASWPRWRPSEESERAARHRRGAAGGPTSAPSWTWCPTNATVVVAAEEELRPGARRPLAGRHHQPPLRRRARPLPAARARSARRSRRAPSVTLSAVSADQPHQFRAQAADTAARTIAEAEPELEKLVRSGYVAVVAWDRRGEAERAAYNLARLRPRFVDDARAPRRGAVVRAGAAARGLHRAAAEGRRDPGPPAAAPAPRRAPGGHARPRVPGVHRAAPGRHRRPHRPRHRPLHRLRHQDGRGRHARLPRGRVPRRRPRLRPDRPARPPEPLRRRRRARRRRSRSSAPRPGTT